MIHPRKILCALALISPVSLASADATADAAPAANALVKAQEPDPALENFLRTLAAYEEGGDYKTILKFTRDWQKSRPLDAQVWFVQARASFYDGDYTAAIASWERAQKLDDALQNDAQKWLDRAHSLKQRWGDQSTLLVTESEITRATREWKTRGRELLDAKNYDEIERIAAQLTASGEALPDGTWAFTLFADGLTERASSGLGEAQWRSKRDEIEAWTKARPDSALARICLARVWDNGAWLARGSNGSWPEGAAKIIEERDNQTATIIEGAGGWTKQMAVTPLSFDVFEGWAMLSGQAADAAFFDQQFDAVTAAFPHYADAYEGDAYHLLARWYGEKNEWQRKAGLRADAYAKKFGAQAGDALYAQIVWRLARSYVDFEPLWTEEATDWPRTKRGMESVLRDHPDSLAAQTFLFDAATANKDWPSALKALQKLNGRVDGEYYLYRRKEFAPQRVATLENAAPPTANP